MTSHERSIAIVAGLDGSGKSTTAQNVARALSSEYSSKVINVADSSGLYTFVGGELTGRRYSRVEQFEPSARCVSKTSVMLHLGAFTVGRRYIGRRGREGDLLISVRDPQRIEPAVYSAVYARNIMFHVSAEKRLKFLDRFTSSPYADRIVHLACDSDAAQASVVARCESGEADPHETVEKLAVAAAELPRVISAYGDLFGTEVQEVAALQPYTTDQVAEIIEPLIATPSTPTPHYVRLAA